MKALLPIGSDRIDTPTHADVINPYTQEVIATVPQGDESTLDHATQIAQEAFKRTRLQPPHERAQLLLKTAKTIEERKSELANLIVAEAGKPITLAEGEVDRAVITFTAAAEEIRRSSGEVLPLDGFAPGAGHFALTKRFPLGVIYGIPPFNFPLNLVAHKVAPCIATGNTMVLKPAPKTPLSSIRLVEILLECGMIPGQINVVTCPNDLAGKLVADDRIKMISFTGSPAIGWQIKSRAGKKRVTLELGGNAGVIVHDDADIAMCIPMIATGAFAYAGQSCISVQRIFIQRSIYNTFRDQFVTHVKDKIKDGNPADRSVLVGPMINPDAAAKTLKMIDDAKAAGAQILCGGRGKGQMIEPTILENVSPSLDVCAKEAFAPIVVVSPYDHFEDAIKMVNDSSFGLQAGVFTRDLNRAMTAFNQLEVGGVMINQVPTWRGDNMPYGGIKDSGFGREGPRYGMEEMTEIRTLVMKL